MCGSVRTEAVIERPRVRSRRSARRIAVRRAVFLTACVAVLAVALGFVLAGSPTTLPPGSSVDGIDVGGMTAVQAEQMLSERAGERETKPVSFVAGGEEFAISPSQLGVVADSSAAVAAALAKSDGVGPVRGYRRLYTRFFGADVVPPVSVYQAALDYKLDQIEAAVGNEAVDAALKLDGLRVSFVPGQSGRRLNRDGAAAAIVGALGGQAPAGEVALAVEVVPPAVTAATLGAASRQARVALAAPVRLTDGTTTWRLSRQQIAGILQPPSGGATDVRIAGPGAESWVQRLTGAIDRPAQDARFALTAQGQMTIVPSRVGRLVDVPATIESLAAAVFAPGTRLATVSVRVSQPQRTTAEARAMGITGVVSSYTTSYGGTDGRLHNVQLVADLIDGTLIAPGSTFSFNGTTGERNAEKGFAEAPVIINGELENGIGGGVCQVSTTVFNAVFEAGLPIEQRNNHALYISHYPLGRDATVNYPDLDLKFRNDTEAWLLLRTFVGAGSLTVNLYGTPTGRRVESVTGPLVRTGSLPVEKVEDPALAKGTRVVVEDGAPPRQTSVARVVYDADGNVLYENAWTSAYVAETKVVRIGTKVPPPKPAKDPKTAAEDGGPPVAPPAAADVSPVASPQ
jgi:vancomycin resistance protein YoaR